MIQDQNQNEPVFDGRRGDEKALLFSVYNQSQSQQGPDQVSLQRRSLL
jgi:hypothetical protein